MSRPARGRLRRPDGSTRLVSRAKPRADERASEREASMSMVTSSRSSAGRTRGERRGERPGPRGRQRQTRTPPIPNGDERCRARGTTPLRRALAGRGLSLYGGAPEAPGARRDTAGSLTGTAPVAAYWEGPVPSVGGEAPRSSSPALPVPLLSRRGSLSRSRAGYSSSSSPLRCCLLVRASEPTERPPLPSRRRRRARSHAPGRRRSRRPRPRCPRRSYASDP